MTTTYVSFPCVECGRPATHLGLAGADPYATHPFCDDDGPGARAPLPRVGRQMFDAVYEVYGDEGVSKRVVAKSVAPRGNVTKGYDAVNRAIDAGLIRALKVDGRYRLYPTPLGVDLISDLI